MTPSKQIAETKKALKNIKTYVRWVKSDIDKLTPTDIDEIENARRHLSLAAVNLLSVIERQNESGGR